MPIYNRMAILDLNISRLFRHTRCINSPVLMIYACPDTIVFGFLVVYTPNLYRVMADIVNVITNWTPPPPPLQGQDWHC